MRLTVVVKEGYLYPGLTRIAPRYIMLLTPGSGDMRLERLTHVRRRRPAFPFEPDTPAHMTEVNYAEVKYIIIRKDGVAAWEEAAKLLDGLPRLLANSIDLVITSPPFALQRLSGIFAAAPAQLLPLHQFAAWE